MILLDEPMSKHTTFGVGGPADVFVVPASTDEAVTVIGACRRLGVPYFVLGKGSNLLVSDEGYRGVIVSFESLTAIEVEDAPRGDALQEDVEDGIVLVCEAGATLRSVAEKACSLGLGGFEFAHGIPGTIGGACFMNAGAYDGCMADVLVSVNALTPDGEIVCVPVQDLALGYRTSRVCTDELVVLQARIRLTPADQGAIRAKMNDLMQRRKDKQPLEFRSAGSTFKRPEGLFAGKLIMDAGLKGYAVGGACVSQKHAGFVVNTGNATAADVCAVIDHVQDEVERQFGVRLEPEVRFLG